MSIFSIDREKESGIPQLAKDFKALVNESDGIIISFAEHNGNFSTAFKNIYDWISRIGTPIWSDKPIFLLATSSGAREGKSVLDITEKSLPFRGAIVSGVFSLPSFGANFDSGITDKELLKEFESQLAIFQSALDR